MEFFYVIENGPYMTSEYENTALYSIVISTSIYFVVLFIIRKRVRAFLKPKKSI